MSNERSNGRTGQSMVKQKDNPKYKSRYNGHLIIVILIIISSCTSHGLVESLANGIVFNMVNTLWRMLRGTLQQPRANGLRRFSATP